MVEVAIMRFHLWFVGVVMTTTSIFWGCSATSDRTAPLTGDAEADGSPPVAPQGPDDGGADGAPTCNGTPMIAAFSAPGALQRVYAELPFGSESEPFLIDMGSAVSVAFTKGSGTFIPDAGATTISCVTASLMGYGAPSTETAPNGKPVRGLLGSDLVSRGATLDLRVAEERFFWWKNPPSVPTNATTLPIVMHEWMVGDYRDRGLVVSNITLDGAPVKLMLDTGSPRVLILSSTPRSNETIEQTTDGNGNPVTLYVSTTRIAFNGGAEVEVALDRAEHFPLLEDTAQKLGSDVVGLLGLGALGHERIMIARDKISFIR